MVKLGKHKAKKVKKVKPKKQISMSAMSGSTSSVKSRNNFGVSPSTTTATTATSSPKKKSVSAKPKRKTTKDTNKVLADVIKNLVRLDRRSREKRIDEDKIRAIIASELSKVQKRDYSWIGIIVSIIGSPIIYSLIMDFINKDTPPGSPKQQSTNAGNDNVDNPLRKRGIIEYVMGRRTPSKNSGVQTDEELGANDSIKTQNPSKKTSKNQQRRASLYDRVIYSIKQCIEYLENNKDLGISKNIATLLGKFGVPVKGEDIDNVIEMAHTFIKRSSRKSIKTFTPEQRNEINELLGKCKTPEPPTQSQGPSQANKFPSAPSKLYSDIVKGTRSE